MKNTFIAVIASFCLLLLVVVFAVNNRFHPINRQQTNQTIEIGISNAQGRRSVEIHTFEPTIEKTQPNTDNVGDGVQQVSFTRPSPLMLQDEIKNLVKNALQFYPTPFGHSVEVRGRQYIVVTGGKDFKGSTFEVEILDIKHVGGKELMVSVRFSPLTGNETEKTENYDLVSIASTKLKVRFIATGDDYYVPITSLVGIDSLSDIVAQSKFIKVFQPAPKTDVRRSFTVTGVARVYEALIGYRLLDENGNQLVSGSTVAADVLNWGYFRTDINIPKTVSARSELRLELYGDNPTGGTESGRIIIPLNFTN